MIVAHHMGEELLPTLVAGGAGAVSVVLAVWRTRLVRLVDRLRRR